MKKQSPQAARFYRKFLAEAEAGRPLLDNGGLVQRIRDITEDLSGLSGRLHGREILSTLELLEGRQSFQQVRNRSD